MPWNLSWAGHKIQSLRPTRTASGANLIPSRFGIWNIYGNFKGSYSFTGLVRAERNTRSREEIGKVTKQQSCARCTLPREGIQKDKTEGRIEGGEEWQIWQKRQKAFGTT